MCITHVGDYVKAEGNGGKIGEIKILNRGFTNMEKFIAEMLLNFDLFGIDF